MARRSFAEGAWFLVPVPEEYRESAPQHRYGAGLVARGRRGQDVFAYIFGPFADVPTATELDRLHPGGELMMRMIRVRTIQASRFPVIHTSEGFSRERWPMPEFHMYMGGNEPAWAIRTSDDNPFEAISKRRVTVAEALALPQWRSGGGYIAIYRKLVDPQSRETVISDLYREPTPGHDGHRSVERPVDVSFVVAQAAKASELERSLGSLGWSVTTDRHSPGDTWLVGTRLMKTTSEALEELDQAMERLASSLPGIEYDGHGIDIAGV